MLLPIGQLPMSEVRSVTHVSGPDVEQINLSCCPRVTCGWAALRWTGLDKRVPRCEEKLAVI